MAKNFLRIARVKAVTGLGSSTIYENIKTGDFPKPILIGKKAVAWDGDEIERWQLSKIAARDANLRVGNGRG